MTSASIARADYAPSRASELSAIDKEIPKRTPAERKRLEAIRGVIEEERHIATSVICNAVIDGKNFGQADVDNDPRGTYWDDYQVAV